MTWLAAAPPLAVLHLVLSGVALLWDLYVARRMTQMRDTPRAIAVLTGMSALLIVPALFLAVTSTSHLIGRALHTLDWVWPLTAILVTVQSALATIRRIVARAVGLPIVAYNSLLTLIYLTRWLASHGEEPSGALLTLVAAQTGAQALGADPRALLAPVWLHVPILAAATPPRRRAGTPIRVALAALATAWSVLIVLSIPPAARAISSFGRYAGERLQERPAGDFAVGLKIFPTIRAGPPQLALRTDLDLADSLGVDALSAYVDPEAASAAALDSLARSLERQRSAGRKLIVAAGYPRHARRSYAASPERYRRARLVEIQRIVRRLRPDYLVPALDPFGAGREALGPIGLNEWKSYLERAARAARAIDPRVRVIAHAGSYSDADRELFLWALGDQSPVQAAAASLLPWYDGAATLESRKTVLDRWLAAAPANAEVWVLEARGFPVSHGERAQERALWAALAWATSRSRVKGFIVYQASDYDSPVGLRAPGGRLRQAVGSLRRAIRSLDESVAETAAR